MDTQQVLDELKSDSPLNRARAKFSSWSARLEQEGMQRNPIGPIEIRALEFKAAEEIITAYNSERT